ncbi:MAG: alanine--tRNA ligase [Candidatus Moraniibacteriota bacterium]|nr:MAG: alanine--tRNA ligase [Candidatus Moranbacteria bacterium]
MQTHQIRAKYLAFFQKKAHAIVPSSPLVPENDPTTLFTGSGMQPILPYLLGERHPLGTRIADSQKCFRSQDIEEVGDNRHTTFFEMLGNWSFGDYFKEKQIEWMWTFLTVELGLDPKRLYFTCFRGNAELGIPRDTESAERWQSLFRSIGIEAAIGEDAEKDGMKPGERIFYYPEKKSWWSRAGVPANMPVGEPGGPDTEMFWDFDPTNEKKMHEASAWKDEPCHVNCDCGRFMEIGNNVFMEYKKTDTGFEKLTQQNVDFGGGLERMAAALADDPDVFRLDVFDGARNMIAQLSQNEYGKDSKLTYAYRIVLDHIRAAVFLAADGISPSNTDQGYVLRRLIRRAIRYADFLGIPQGELSSIAYSFIMPYMDAYPDVNMKSVLIVGEIDEEERKFRSTLANGMKELERRLSRGQISGKDAFDLFTTYGFPFELTEEIVIERGGKIDKEEFNTEFKRHQDLSRTASAGKFKGGLADHSAKVTAYHTATHLMLAGLRKELGNDVHQAGSNITEERTRFDFTYPEKVPRETLDRVEAYVNAAIAAGATVATTVMEKEAAKAAGVEGSFWEKYPEKVTVYQVTGPDGTVYSEELCGGPHVSTTADIAAFGRFRITKEEASSAGVRRVKAVLEED